MKKRQQSVVVSVIIALSLNATCIKEIETKCSVRTSCEELSSTLKVGSLLEVQSYNSFT